LNLVVFDEQQVFNRAFDEILQLFEGLIEGFFSFGFGEKAERALGPGGFRIFINRDDVNRDVTSGEVHFESVQHAPAIHVWQMDIKGDGRRLKVPHHGESVSSALRHNALKAFFMRHFEKDTPVIGVILDNENRIIQNQQAIIKNQKKILANQSRILAK